MIIFILQLLLLFVIVAVLVAIVLIFKARKEGQQLYAQYALYTDAMLTKNVTLIPVPIKREFQVLKPWKAFGMFINVARIMRGGKFKRINAFESTIGIFMKMFTILFFPDYTYNVPIMSVDIIFMGKRRVFVIEIIDTAKLEDDNIKTHYARMRALKPQIGLLHQTPVNRWYKDVITDFSIHAREDRTKDDLLFDIYQKYLSIYIDMIQQAQPMSQDLSIRVEKSIKEYIDTLISQGGPAVDLLVKLMGQEKQREYVYTVMFGI